MFEVSPSLPPKTTQLTHPLHSPPQCRTACDISQLGEWCIKIFVQFRSTGIKVCFYLSSSQKSLCSLCLRHTLWSPLLWTKLYTYMSKTWKKPTVRMCQQVMLRREITMLNEESDCLWVPIARTTTLCPTAVSYCIHVQLASFLEAYSWPTLWTEHWCSICLNLQDVFYNVPCCCSG